MAASPINFCSVPLAPVLFPTCAGQAAAQGVNQATGGGFGQVLGDLLNPVQLGQNAATTVNQATGGAAQGAANSVLNAFAQVAGAKSFVDLEQRGLLIGSGIFFIFLGFIVLFFAHGGAETVVNLASPGESEAGEAGAGESNAAKLGEAAEVAA